MSYEPTSDPRRAELLASLPASPTEAIETLVNHVLELEADKSRLDWLEKKGFSTNRDGREEKDMAVHSWRESPNDSWKWTAHWIGSEFTNARDAIDAAMKGTSNLEPVTDYMDALQRAWAVGSTKKKGNSK